MTESTSPARRPGYHVLLYTVGAVLAAGALICLVLVFAAPEIRGMQGLAVASIALASAVIGATAIHRKVDQLGREVLASDGGVIAHSGATDRIDQLADRVEELARDFIKRYPPQVSRETGRPLERRRNGRRRSRSVEADPSVPSAGDNVVPLPSQETREAARRLARRVIQREEQER